MGLRYIKKYIPFIFLILLMAKSANADVTVERIVEDEGLLTIDGYIVTIKAPSTEESISLLAYPPNFIGTVIPRFRKIAKDRVEPIPFRSYRSEYSLSTLNWTCSKNSEIAGFLRDILNAKKVLLTIEEKNSVMKNALSYTKEILAKIPKEKLTDIQKANINNTILSAIDEEINLTLDYYYFGYNFNIFRELKDRIIEKSKEILKNLLGSEDILLFSFVNRLKIFSPDLFDLTPIAYGKRDYHFDLIMPTETPEDSYYSFNFEKSNTYVYPFPSGLKYDVHIHIDKIGLTDCYSKEDAKIFNKVQKTIYQSVVSAYEEYESLRKECYSYLEQIK